ncbi:MAG: host-nuclease inhibitor Gam family protein [Hydrogenophaga sp.]|nr:host-nuclease inhibitor Gam family protein [Hydrogenophaga sp.]MDZ4127270.1 host-nuclease inhibitor Gam family protein [Hydrogenophaga sp.]
MASKKMKAPAAAVPVPQSRADCAADIKKLGDAQRDFERTRAEMNDAIATITQRYQPSLEALDAQCQALAKGIQTWCEANRATLCENGKTANLVTGEVSWRQRPPSVRISGADSVIETLRRMQLERFVRTKDEVNKEAMLNEPDAVRGIAGISIVTGVEDFAVVPFAVDVEVAA